MKTFVLAGVIGMTLALGGCGKASKEDCTKAAANLKDNGGLIGKVMAQQMLKEDGENKCEGRFSSKQANCLADLKKFDEAALKGCD